MLFCDSCHYSLVCRPNVDTKKMTNVQLSGFSSERRRFPQSLKASWRGDSGLLPSRLSVRRRQQPTRRLVVQTLPAWLLVSKERSKCWKVSAYCQNWACIAFHVHRPTKSPGSSSSRELKLTTRNIDRCTGVKSAWAGWLARQATTTSQLSPNWLLSSGSEGTFPSSNAVFQTNVTNCG